MSTPSRAPRNSLSLERLVAAAMELADEQGLAGLTIRALAARLSVRPMAAYHYISDKEQLLDLIVDGVFEQIERPTPGLPWRPELHRRCLSVRAAMRRHPWALGLVDSRTSAGPATLAAHDAVLGTMLSDGFSPAQAARAFALLDSYVYGFALQENSIPLQDPSTAPDVVAAMLEAMDADLYPHLVSFTLAHVLVPGYDFGDEFEPGLDLVLDAIAGLR